MSSDALTRALDLNHHPSVTVFGALITWVASKAPDIDNPRSRPGQQLNKIIPGMSDTIKDMFGHRGLTHWGSVGITNGIIIGTIAMVINPSLWWIGLAATVGWITHILGDCCTYKGAPAYAPFSRSMVRLPYGYRLESGGTTEFLVVYPLAFVWALLMTMASVALTLFA